MEPIQRHLRSTGSISMAFVMAAPQEYGTALRELGVLPFFCGVGMVEAGINTAHFLRDLRDAESIPELIISLGSGGSWGLDPMLPYEIASLRHRDMDASAIPSLDVEPGETPLSHLPKIIEIPTYLGEDVPKASLSSGSSIVHGEEAFANTGADIADMETLAVMQACWTSGVPCMGLRAISDGQHPVADWLHKMPTCDEVLAAAIRSLDRAVLEGALLAAHLRLPQAWLDRCSRRRLE